MLGVLRRMSEEAPFRLFSRAFLKAFSNSIRTKSYWDAVARPHYLAGVLGGADQALREGKKEISVYEFGVASGNGLLELQKYAEEVEKETGIKISVFGFDNGKGLPELCGDYRDHPDQWMAGDYFMDEAALRKRLLPRTELIIGNISESVPKFVRERSVPPVGFIAMDVDLYSSTMEAFHIFTFPANRLLNRIPMYFDDVNFVFNHRFAGELLAIEEFNRMQSKVRIDVWRGLEKGRPFPENAWLRNMYMAHNLEAISNFALQRKAAIIELQAG